MLRAIHRGTVVPEWPQTGLALPWLFTAGKGSPSLLYELRRELAACDQVDILVSFITHSGVRKLLDVLHADNDHAASAARALQLARDWGSQAAILPGAGHINVKSGHQRWEQGFAYLYRLQRQIEQLERLRA